MSRRRAFGSRWPLVGLVGLLLGGSLLLPGASAAAAEDPRAACRSWTSQLQPPPSVRVYRTRGAAAGTVQTVPFKRYVAVVMAAEWPAWMPRETLRAGAVAVKQYAWFYSVFYRGWQAPDGRCFHVMDTSTDQVYWPELRVPSARHHEAIGSTWRLSLHRPAAAGGSRLILTSYRQGFRVPCGSDRDGLKIFQLSAQACGVAGVSAKAILRTYYGELEFVDVRQHDILRDGAWRGDAALLSGVAGKRRTDWRLLPATASGFGKARSGSIALDPALLLDKASADVTGDGLSDLVLLVRVGEHERQLIVLAGGGAGYRSPQLRTRWREADSDDARRLLLADFTGDGLADPAVLRAVRGGRTSFAQASLLVRPAVRGGGFGQAHELWRGGFDPARNTALAADLTGDGRADLLVSQDRGRNGLGLWVMASRPTGGKLLAARLWLERSDWRAATTSLQPIDENRDGRDDLFAVRPRGSTGITVFALRAQAGGRFRVSARWTSPRGSALAWQDVQAVPLHVDGDGRGDLAVFRRGSAGAAELFWLRTTDARLQASRNTARPGVAWKLLAAY